MTIVTSRWPPIALPIKAGQNLEPAYSELIAVHAGNLATLYGHINGGETVGGEPNAAPRNPSGDFGHDHSGGDFGRPFFRSVCTVTCDNGNVSGGTAIAEGGAAVYLTIANGADSEETISNTHEIPFWCPPCDPVSGAYLDLGLYARVQLRTTALLAGDTLTLRVWVQTSDDTPQVTTYTLSAPNSTGTKDVSSGSTTRLRCAPGRVNLLHLQAAVDRTTGGSSRGAQLYVRELELGVYSV